MSKHNIPEEPITCREAGGLVCPEDSYTYGGGADNDGSRGLRSIRSRPQTQHHTHGGDNDSDGESYDYDDEDASAPCADDTCEHDCDNSSHDHGEVCSDEACQHDHSHVHHDHTLEDTCTSCDDGTCWLEHHHDHDHAHGTSCNACSDDGCGCGHNHEHGAFEAKEKVLLGAGIGIFLVSLIIPMAQPMQLIAMLCATLIAGYPVFKDGVKSIFKLSFDETALMTIAVIAAFFIGDYSEAVIVTLFFRVGNLLENIAVTKSRRDIENLTKIREDNTSVLEEDGSITVTPSKDVAVGTKIAIKPGEKVPIDGVIVKGNSSMDTSALTGESLSRAVSKGDTLLSGMINLEGMLICETTNTFDDSAASKIIELVRDSVAKKGKTENFISRFAKVYTPLVMLAAAILAFVPPLLGFGDFQQWIGRSLVFLVASCPCALVISIPLSFFAGIGASSKVGVLVKGSKYIEIISKADCIVFDKTGTLTTGKLSVTTVKSCSNSYSTDDVLRLAATAERYSTHPMAEAVTTHYGEVDLSEVSEFSEIAGKGVSLNVGEDVVLCGSHRLMDDFEVDISMLPSANIYLSVNGTAVGYLVLSDTPRSDAKDTITKLKQLGIKRTVMLTGDNHSTAEKVKELCGVDQVFAELLPGDKVSHMEEIKEQAEVTLFVGDGINDAPVLAMADAGIAMGLGTDAAIEAADVVLLSDNLSSLPKAIAISRRTMSIAKFNIVFALAVKAVVLVLGAVGMAAMWMAIVADVGVSVLSVLNATRILKSQEQE